MRQFAERLALLLDALGIESYRYCGLSMGGALGMELALLHPARMQKLVLSNTAAQFGAADFWNRRSATAMEQGMTALADATIARWFTAEAALAYPLNLALARDMFLSTQADGYAQCCAAIRDFDFTARLPQIRVPTLVIAGTRDMACTAEQARVLADSIPGARYSELPVAHLGNLGAGAEFTSALFSFLTSL
ncbi:hypothetical protein GCM10011396_15780 [Undibacterium terreum]|uniref:AB hydrolase-1 domain-containing protein n=2 Tax=Undibacterium terreum TaxID=1224302 RepID=A0A916UE27_9BURK|nr:hypothetical protein GCM10011396_15780 [Undibacterium terreum]